MGKMYFYATKPAVAAEFAGMAQALGKDSVALVFDEDAATDFASTGVNEVVVVKGESPLVENYGKAMADLVSEEGADLLVVESTPTGRDLAARVAGYLDAGMVSDATAVALEGTTLDAQRMMYGGAVVQSEQADGFVVVTMTPGKFDPSAAGEAAVRTYIATPDNRVTLIDTEVAEAQSVDISEADRVVCVGMGIDNSPDDIAMAEALASAMGAEVACTRGVAEERHLLPVERYIGLSGKEVSPKVYVGIGVSGQIQHTCGFRDADIVVAVNNDDKALIFSLADYGIVGDMHEVVPALTKALQG